jgi:hypothetical protein
VSYQTSIEGSKKSAPEKANCNGIATPANISRAVASERPGSATMVWASPWLQCRAITDSAKKQPNPSRYVIYELIKGDGYKEV